MLMLNRVAFLFAAIIVVAVGYISRDEQLASISFPAHIDRLFAAIPEPPPAGLMGSEGQTFMQTLPAVGREDVHAAQETWPIRASECKVKASKLSALQEIVDAAKDTTVVIINEAHDRPRHRDFIRQLAIELLPLGYTVFAAETFSRTIDDRPPTPYPLTQDGHYSSEPAFGSLLRDLIERDFRFVPYEHVFDNSDGSQDLYERTSIREEGQASNLQRIIGSMKETERLLVHVGYSHASEVPISSFGGKELAWMAARLKDKSGINPVTIDQTNCLVAEGESQVTEPGPKSSVDQFDFTIGHPPLQFHRGRPAWRQEAATRLVNLRAEFLSTDERVIVEVRPYGEPPDSVPVDRLMLWPGEDLPLIVDQGRYQLVSYFEISRRSVSGEISVAGDEIAVFSHH